MTFVDTFNDDSLPKLLDTLGEDITISPQVGIAFDMRVIFDENYKLIDEQGFEIDSKEPRITYKTENAPDLKRDDAIVFNGRNFTVEDIQNEDVSVSMAYLHKVV